MKIISPPLLWRGFFMNKYQKDQIVKLRGQGESCSKIAAHLGISVNTVKSFCRRHINKGKIDICPQCGNKITQISGRKPKKFCKDECRVKWWNSHSEEVNRKAVYSFKCACCGKDFTAYGNAKRRYCSHSCYCKDRFQKAVAV